MKQTSQSKPITFLSDFSTIVLRENRGAHVKLYSLRTEFFVLFLSQNFCRKFSYFYETASFMLLIVKLLQLIKWSPSDFMTKTLLPLLVYHNCNSTWKDRPNARNEWALTIMDQICVFSKAKNSAHCQGDVNYCLNYWCCCLFAPLPFQVFNVKEQSQFGFTCIVL